VTLQMVNSLHQLRYVINRSEECSDEAFRIGASYNFCLSDCNMSFGRAITFFLQPLKAGTS